MTLKDLEEQALRLPVDERASLAHKLLLSLDELSPEELDEAWLIEAERRARELDRGEVKPVPIEELRRRVRTVLR